MKTRNIQLAAVIVAFLGCMPALRAATVTAKNGLDIARPSETIEVQWKDVAAALPDAKADNVRVSEGGKMLMSQPIDMDGDGTPEWLIFQSNFAPGESKTFALSTGALPAPKVMVMARHVPERYDDFAFENDRVGFRIYGKALETVEPGSSGIDTWQKNTRELVMDKWYA